jgi:hypothetical protein
VTASDDQRAPIAPETDQIAASVSAHVRELMAQAEQSARQVRDEVEARTARQAAETRVAAETDAERIRHAAETQAAQYLADARLRVEEYARARQQRIDDLTGELLERATVLQRRLDEAIDVRARLDETLDALSATRDLIGTEAERPIDPAPPLEPSAADQRVRAAAGELPERLAAHTNRPGVTEATPPEDSA